MTDEAYKPLNEAERDLYRFVLARRSADGGVRNAPVEAARAVLRVRAECIRTGDHEHIDVPLEVSAAMARDAMADSADSARVLDLEERVRKANEWSGKLREAIEAITGACRGVEFTVFPASPGTRLADAINAADRLVNP